MAAPSCRSSMLQAMMLCHVNGQALLTGQRAHPRHATQVSWTRTGVSESRLLSVAEIVADLAQRCFACSEGGQG